MAQESNSPAATSQAITLDRIMADPQWLGRSPQRAYWSDDSGSVYYQRRRAGSQQQDWYQADLQGNLLRVVEDKDRGGMDSDDGQYSRDRKWKAYERAGDLFLKDLQTGATRQLTRTRQRESSPRFMADGKRLMFRRDDAVLARHLKNGLEQELVNVRWEKDPAESRQKDREGFLPEQQQRLFEYLRKRRLEQDAARQAADEQQAADPTRVPLPWYLGDSHRLDSVQASPNGRWCLLSLASKQASRGEPDKMPEFVEDSGYVNVRNVRPLVGTGKAVSDKLILLDLVQHVQHELSFSDLPDFDTDPLADVRAEADAWRKKQAEDSAGSATENSNSTSTTAKEQSTDKSPEKSPKSGDSEQNPPSAGDEAKEETAAKEKKVVRAIQVGSIAWNDIGDQVAVQLFSADNKDRWIATVDLRARS